MQIALIPPIPELGSWDSTGIHLLLSHLLQDQRYMQYYRDQRKKGDYLILDNSAHEFGAGNGAEVLLEQAEKLRAQEVVVPDVLFDARATIESGTRALRWMAGDGWEAYSAAGRPRLMLVPQGDTRPEWASCLKHLLLEFDRYSEKAPTGFGHPVIGISKDYDYWRGGLAALIDDYVAPLYHRMSLDVHCLGWPSDLWSLARVKRNFPWVRSTDSAKPFVYAKNGILLEPGGPVPAYPRRDKDYFTEEIPAAFRETAWRNIQVFQAAARDELVSSEV